MVEINQDFHYLWHCTDFSMPHLSFCPILNLHLHTHTQYWLSWKSNIELVTFENYNALVLFCSQHIQVYIVFWAIAIKVNIVMTEKFKGFKVKVYHI